MPISTYHPRHKPPTWLDRIFVRPVQTIGLGVASVLVGLLLAVGQATGCVVSPPIAELDHWQGWLMAAPLYPEG